MFVCFCLTFFQSGMEWLRPTAEWKPHKTKAESQLTLTNLKNMSTETLEKV